MLSSVLRGTTSVLFSAKLKSMSVVERGYAKLWKEMETTGVLSLELVDQVFSEFCHEGLAREDILNMMEQFGLIVKFVTSPTDEKYFVPCQLNTPPEALYKLIETSPSDPCPLYLCFQRGFVPHGLFGQLVSQCTRWCSKSGFKQPPNLFDGAAQFVIEKDLIHHLILISKKRFIKIVLKQMKQELTVSLAKANVEEVTIMVRRFLEDTMQNLSRELPWLKNLKYELCVECPYCLKMEKKCSNHEKVSCNDEDCMCFLKIFPDGPRSYCPKSLCGEILRLPQLEKWFSIRGGFIFNVLQQMEHDVRKGTTNTDLSLELEKIASDKGFMISDNQGGGNCMFHALSEQLNLVKGIKISHQDLRHKVVNYLKNNPKLPDGTELFNFVDGYSSWDSYLRNMGVDGTWGDHVILHGVANCFRACIHVISSQSHHNDVTINPERDVTNSNRLMLGHLHELHYVSLIPRTLSVKEGSPSNDELEGLSRKIEDWESLGRRLKFDQGMLHGFHKDNDKWSEKSYAMLIAWKKREGSAATYQVLHQVLCHEFVNRGDLAEEFCCHVQIPPLHCASNNEN